MEHLERKGANLEIFKGRPAYYTARMTRGWRFLVRKESDAQGTYYLVVGYRRSTTD